MHHVNRNKNVLSLPDKWKPSFSARHVSCSCMTQKCENHKSFSCLIYFHTLCCHSLLHPCPLGTHDGHLPLRQHGEWGDVGAVYLLRENWKRGHRDAAGDVWTWGQLSAEGQRDCARGLLSVCEVSCLWTGFYKLDRKWHLSCASFPPLCVLVGWSSFKWWWGETHDLPQR